jgi:membrane-associated phospholipid phosphatase
MNCTWKHKLELVGLYALAFLFFYLYPNLAPWFEPKQLPLLALDQRVPFLPWTFWVYTSDYLLIGSVVFLLRERAHVDEFARMALGVLVGCGCFFLCFPTTYPRPAYPESGSSLGSMPMRFIAAADTPGNCFPSMHVALTGVAAWAVRRRSRQLALSYGVWTLAICLSTLTTKQHYVWDVAGGVVMMMVVACGDRWLAKETRLWAS